MSESTPTATAGWDPNSILNEIFSGGNATPTPRPRRPLEGLSLADMRQWYRAGALSYDDWLGELVARGETQAQAAASIASALTIGLSTAKGATPGQLTPGEQAAVNAIATSVANQPTATPTTAPTATPTPTGGGPGLLGQLRDLTSRTLDAARAGQAAQAGGAPAPVVPPPAAPAAAASGGTTGGGAAASGGSPAAAAPAPPAPKRIWDFFTDSAGNPMALIYETGKTVKLPKGTQEDDVTAVYEVMRHLPENSPNFMDIFQQFQQAKLDRGVDEYGRPYYDEATDASTRYSGPPLPEKLPRYMQQGIIDAAIDEEAYAEPRAEGGTARSGKTPQVLDKAHGIDLSLFGDPRLVRSRGGDQLYVDYPDAGDSGLAPPIGPVIGPRGGVFATVEEAEKAAYAYGREAASRQAEAARASGEESLVPTIDRNDPRLRELTRRPLDFAYGGELELRRPTSLVDQSTGQVMAQAAMNGPERLKFGGEYWGKHNYGDYLGKGPYGPQPQQPQTQMVRVLVDRFGGWNMSQMQAYWRAEQERLDAERLQNSGRNATSNPRLVQEDPRHWYMKGEPLPKPELRRNVNDDRFMRVPLNFMEQPPMVGTPVERPGYEFPGQRKPRPVYNPERMLSLMKTG